MVAAAGVRGWGWAAAAVLAAGFIALLALHGERPEPGLARFQPAGLLADWPIEQVTSIELRADEEAAEAPRGPIPLAVAAEGRLGAGDAYRLVAFGDADFASNSFFPYLANADMVLGSLSWLIHEERAPVIKPPVEVLPTVALTGAQARGIFIATVLVLPGAVALFGGFVWWRRRA